MEIAARWRGCPGWDDECLLLWQFVEGSLWEKVVVRGDRARRGTLPGEHATTVESGRGLLFPPLLIAAVGVEDVLEVHAVDLLTGVRRAAAVGAGVGDNHTGSVGVLCALGRCAVLRWLMSFKI